MRHRETTCASVPPSLTRRLTSVCSLPPSLQVCAVYQAVVAAQGAGELPQRERLAETPLWGGAAGKPTRKTAEDIIWGRSQPRSGGNSISSIAPGKSLDSLATRVPPEEVPAQTYVYLLRPQTAERVQQICAGVRGWEHVVVRAPNMISAGTVRQWQNYVESQDREGDVQTLRKMMPVWGRLNGEQRREVLASLGFGWLRTPGSEGKNGITM